MEWRLLEVVIEHVSTDTMIHMIRLGYLIKIVFPHYNIAIFLEKFTTRQDLRTLFQILVYDTKTHILKFISTTLDWPPKLKVINR